MDPQLTSGVNKLRESPRLRRGFPVPSYPPVSNIKHEKAAVLDHAGRGQPGLKGGGAGAASGKPKEPKPMCNASEMFTSVQGK